MAIPIILDTDIGFDVDDVWALVFLLKCPELDVKLITTTTGDTWYRAALVAKILTIAGRTDIPIGVGIPLDYSAPTHEAWLGDFQLSEYPGVVIEDGIGALCETVLNSQEPVSLIGIGPLPNIAAALSRSPTITEQCTVYWDAWEPASGVSGRAQADARIQCEAARLVGSGGISGTLGEGDYAARYLRHHCFDGRAVSTG